MSVLRILLIDDDEDEFLITQSHLSRLNEKEYALYWEPEYDKAKQHLIDQDYDVFLIDYHLGAKSGLQLINETLSGTPLYKPVIILTGQSVSVSDLEFIQNGASDYLLKGDLNPAALERSIRYSLERYRSLADRFQSQQLYQNLFNQARDPHFILNKELVITNANRAFIQLFELNKGRWRNMPFETLFKNLDELKEFVYLSQTKPDFSSFEATLVSCEQHREFDCTLSCNVLLDTKGNVDGYQGIIQDQTQRKKIERENRLAEKYAMTGRISRMIAHEVRNPLTNIKLALSQIINSESEVPGLSTYTDIINRNANRINDLISSLLNASIPADLQLKPVSMQRVMEAVVEIVKDRALLKGIDIVVDTDPNLPEIEADEDRLSIAITNLLVNATEAIDHDHGRITVQAHVLNNHHRIRISIADNGQGMTKEVMKNLFEPFFTRKKSGTGLGLTTTHNIIKSHKGELSCKSVEGKGSEFIILL